VADTQTVSLGLLLQETGGNDGIWGDKLNDEVIQLIEDALVGRQAISTTGGTTALTQAQARPAFLDITGTLVSDATIQVPNTKNRWIITNNTTGNFAVLVKTSAGAATSVPQGTSKEVYCDGANGVFRTDRDHVGKFFYHAGTAVPSGALECTGAAVSRTGIGIDLFAKISTTWGVGDGSTTFNVPNSFDTGRYLRSSHSGVPQGTSQADQNKSHNHTASASTSTTPTIDAVGNHGHGVSDPAHNHAYSGTHSHGYSDPTHGHTYGFQPVQDGGSNLTAGVGSPSATVRQISQSLPSTNTAAAATGISISAAGSGISISGAGTGISIQGAGGHTHSASASSSTSVTVNADGGAEARPTSLVGILCVRL
jgi:hypothetical protein